MNDPRGFEPLPSARFSEEFVEGTSWLVARASRNWLVIPFLAFWLTGWTAGGIGAFVAMLSGEGQLFLVVWLVFWAFGWFFAASWIAWQLAGWTRVGILDGALVHEWKMPFVGRAKRYDVREVRNPRQGVSPWPWGSGLMNVSYPPFFPSSQGSVHFDYGGRTVKIMPGLDEAEGGQIAEWIEARLPERSGLP